MDLALALGLPAAFQRRRLVTGYGHYGQGHTGGAHADPAGGHGQHGSHGH